MVFSEKIAAGNPYKVAGIGLFLLVAALPWIDRTNLSTLLLIGFGATSLVRLVTSGEFAGLLKTRVALFSTLYYCLYLVAWIHYPADSATTFALQQKIAFLLVPPVIYGWLSYSKKIWPFAVWGLISGTCMALLVCLINALVKYQTTHDAQVFFYHTYVSCLVANAIYISVFTLVAMVFVTRKLGTSFHRKSNLCLLSLLLFLLGNLLLLSSKTLIAAGFVMLFIYGLQHLKSFRLKAIVYGSLAALLIVVGSTNNEIKNRYLTIKWKESVSALRLNDYSNTNFDGLDLRLLLWRMGSEVVAEHHAWFTGMGGRRYQAALDQKIMDYKLYPGYLHIDLHNQYMETYVGFGWLGLAFFLTLLGYLILVALKNDRKDLLMLCMIFCTSFLTESLLENQAGILLFTIIISGEWIQRQLY